MGKIKRLLGILLCCFLSSSFIHADSYITDGKSIVAYGNDGGAWLITATKLILIYNYNINKWVSIGQVNDENIVQMDSLYTGSQVIGTDIAGNARSWNMQTAGASWWSKPRPGKKYDYVRLDPVTHATKGLKRNLKVWEEWDKPSPVGGDPWYKYKSAGPEGSLEMIQYLLVNKGGTATRAPYTGACRWDRGDTNHELTLNFNGTANPFNIYYFGTSEQAAIDRMTAPPLGTTNIGTVFVKQISYDELYHNLWAIDIYGQPWQWDNVAQQWILRNVRGPGGYVPPLPPDPLADIKELIKEYNDYYIKTIYMEGAFRPIVIILRDSKMMQLILGELSTDDLDDLEVIILGRPAPSERFHNILLKPLETPQKIVRIDGGGRIAENYYLETLFLKHGIIASPNDLGAYPSEQLRIRR